MTLTEFCTAQLEKDEQVALATLDINVRAGMRLGKPVPRWLPEPDNSGIWDEKGTRIVAHTWVREREHITRHDPARVLRQVEAGRRTLALHKLNDRGECAGCGVEGPNEYAVTEDIDECPELRNLASIWADHDDYLPRWEI